MVKIRVHGIKMLFISARVHDCTLYTRWRIFGLLSNFFMLEWPVRPRVKAFVSANLQVKSGLMNTLQSSIALLGQRAALAADAVQAVCNGPSMSAAQSTTVHGGLLHPHLSYCSSPASAVRRLPSAVRTSTQAFDVRSSGLFCSWPCGLELVTRLPARSVAFLWQFLPGPENFFSRFTIVHITLETLRLCRPTRLFATSAEIYKIK